MGRERQPHPVLKLFEYDQGVNKSRCVLGLCKERNTEFKGQHVGYLTSHLERFHKEEHARLLLEKEALIVSRQLEANNPPSKRRKIENTVSVKIDAKEVIKACVTLVTENGRPFKSLDDIGFRMILDPILVGLGGTLSVNAENIGKHVDDVALEMRQAIKKAVQNRLVCVKIDCAKRMSRSFLGINIQYAQNGKIELRNLSTSELTDRQTGATLKRMVCDVLKEFDIKLSQVYAVTTDNGANIALAVRLLAKQCDSNVAEEQNQIENDDDGSLLIFSIFLIYQTV